jgi:hypothetical protein
VSVLAGGPPGDNNSQANLRRATIRALRDEGRPFDDITYAIQSVKIITDVRRNVIEARRTNPASYSVITWDPNDVTSFACRIVGTLLDIGWTPPTEVPG